MEKRLLQLLFLGLIVFGTWKVWHPLWRYDLNEAVEPGSTANVIFEVEQGQSATRIAKNLESADLILNDLSFLRTVEQEDLSGSLRYGRFVLSPGMTLRDIITVLTTEGTGEMAVTILEGWTIEDIDTHLSSSRLLSAGEFQNCISTCSFDYSFLPEDGNLEGYLFPDTYFISSANFSAESFINQLLRTFDQRLSEDMLAQVEANGRTLHETVIVASMIEKEVRTSPDIPIVGGIIWKRLDNDWTLGIDATLLYVQDDNELTAVDLAEDTPYNTRLYTGLPPTAISNPGLASLEGAIYPESSDYWFYLTTLDTGEVIYGKSNEEHEANKALYLN